jgi:hypothetical protein
MQTKILCSQPELLEVVWVTGCMIQGPNRAFIQIRKSINTLTAIHVGFLSLFHLFVLCLLKRLRAD